MFITKFASKQKNFNADDFFLCEDSDLFEFLKTNNVPVLSRSSKGWYFSKTKKLEESLNKYRK